MPRRDPVSRRLLSVFKLWKTSPQRHVLALEIYREGKSTGEMKTIMEWKHVPNEIKDRFFPHLREIELLPEMAAAFQMAGLDRTQPQDWYQLVALFAWACVGDRRSKGAPTKWDSAKYCALIADFNEKKRKNPALSDEDVFSSLGKTDTYRTKRGPLSTSRLRKLLKEANDPTRNKLLKAAQLRDESIQF
jgi:hypothetical protein